MSRQPELYQWIDTVVMRFPSLSKPQALGLALWSSLDGRLADWPISNHFSVISPLCSLLGC
jgi:hypothetical protein